MVIEHDSMGGCAVINLKTEELMLLRDGLASACGVHPGGDGEEHLGIDDDSCTQWLADIVHDELNAAVIRQLEVDGYPHEVAVYSAAEFIRSIALDDVKSKSGDFVKLVSGVDYANDAERDRLIEEAKQSGVQKVIIDFTGHTSVRNPPAEEGVNSALTA